jgi:hypothetical protein
MDAIKELWVLRVTDDDGKGNVVRATDCAGDPVLAYLTEADAKNGAQAHLDLWDIGCNPEKVAVQ